VELSWAAGDVDVKCFAERGRDGAWSGRVVFASTRGGAREEASEDLTGHWPSEAEAVAAAERRGRETMPPDAGRPELAARDEPPRVSAR
jgi:hypothetical protein